LAGTQAERSSDARVLAWSLLLGLLAVAVAAGPLGGLGRLDPAAPEIEWYWLALGFAATELFAVHLEIRGDVYSLNFSEVPVVLGLIYASPLSLILGRVVGAFVALGPLRRQSPKKLLFNVSMFGLEAALTVWIYRALLGDRSPVDPLAWPPAFVATFSALLISALCVTVVITIYSGWPGWAAQQRVVMFGAIGASINTATGLAIAAALWLDMRNALLLVVLIAAVPLFYRAYVELNERYRNLTALHDFTRGVTRSINLTEVAHAVLAGARDLLRAERAGLLLLPIGAEDAAFRFVADDRGATSSEAETADVIAEIGLLLPDGVARLIDPSADLPKWLAAVAPKDLAAAPVLADGNLVGALIVADRLTEVTTFVAEDLRLFETVANHASVALQKGRLVTQLQQEVAHRAHQALHDALTDLPNRVLLNDLVGTEVDRAWRQGGRVGLLLIDLETFKEVNDTLGHDTGDRLLLQVCERIQAFLPSEAVLARFGGDEFAVLVPSVADANEALHLAQRLHASFEAPFVSDAVSLAIGINVGVAVYPDHATDVATLFQRADAATYAARLDRAGYELYSPERDPYTPRRLALAAELREAIEASAIDVWFQPKVQITTGIVKGAEALVRWNHPRLGALNPAQFIPAAEHTGVIRPLTLFVVARALEQCRGWRSRGLDLGVAVNVSARNLLDLHLVDDISAILSHSELPPSVLTLELTESTVMSESRRSLEILEGLHALGLRISVDDFGTGYSSLAHLRRLPITEIKIDRSFIATMAVNESDRAIVRSILELGRSLGLRTVAEGVENADAWELLREFRCEEAQGYFISRPIASKQFAEWISGRAVGRLGARDRPVIELEAFRRPSH
jgi:diguanylate cyclase (GGDEF)-like protein